MGGFVLLAILAGFVAFVLPIILAFQLSGLKNRLAQLESKFRKLEERPPVASEAVLSDPVVQEEVAPEPDEIFADTSETEPDEPVVADTETTDIPADPANEIRDEYVPASPPKAFVFNDALGANIKDWLQKNWFFAVAGISLALAGVFLVQYGVDNGLLTPRLRVLGAILFGAILIGAGEYIRRKVGSDEDGSFELLPSVFSGAGLISVFAGILSARQLYDLIGATPAMIGLTIVGLCAIVFGWYYGPFLAILGVLGALLSPFIVGGSGESAQFLYIYFAGIAGVALAIDSFKRWAWLSVLGVIGAYIAAVVLYLGIGAPHFLIGFAILVAVMAIVIPERKLIPQFDGGMLSTFFAKIGFDAELPGFATRIGAAAFVGAAVTVGSVYFVDNFTPFFAIAALTLLVAAGIFWFTRAPALSDLAYVPAAGLLGVFGLAALKPSAVLREWSAAASRESIAFPPMTVAIIVGIAIAVTLAFAWRSWKFEKLRIVDAAFGAAFAVIAAIILEVFWQPESVLRNMVWALYLASIAAVMTILAERFARIDQEDRTRPALFALSAITMVSFMCFVIFGSVGLTVSLAVLAGASAIMAQRFNLPMLNYYTQVAVIGVTWRLVVIPGFVWGFEAELLSVLFVFLASIGILIGTYFVRRADAPDGLRVVLESAIWSLSGVFITIMLARFFEYIEATTAFLLFSIFGLIWLIMAFNQIWRIRPGAALRRTRITLAAMYTVIGGGAMFMSTIYLNPLFGVWTDSITGPYIIDGLFGAYVIPSIFFGVVAVKFKHLPYTIRQGLGWLSAAFAALYIGLEIRRWWHNPYLDYGSVADGELYAYTVAMLIVAAGLLGFAFVRKSATLRKIALVLVGVIIVKVFLLDMSGLDGLLRVVSFLVLGLVLAAMALINRMLQKNEQSLETIAQAEDE